MESQPKKNNVGSTHLKKGSKGKRTSFLQALVLISGSIILFFSLLEGAFFFSGVKPVSSTEDPFVGFAANVPLFTERVASDGTKVFSTAPNKLTHFNEQDFVTNKAPGTYRIFCMGGSTTFGRPYNSSTSFSGWLGDLLPAAQKEKNWEVVNVGGVSYASYRVARLMEELVQYEPDLFIIYTGHNEFLEERSYRDLRQLPEAFRDSVSLLTKSRTWAVMRNLLERFGASSPHATQPQKVQLAAEVDTILEHSTGPKDYHRDDELSANVLKHFRVSLERIVSIARQAGAKIIFVTPASNLKNCSPFKSEHTDGLEPSARERTEALLAGAREDLNNERAGQALAALNEALSLDPRYAELHYWRGKTLFKMKKHDEALTAFRKARDEDVCPLRALSPMPGIVATVAQENDVPLVDFIGIIEKRMLESIGHPIPGEELFLDHVHPTIEGHKLLALSLVDTMIDMHILQPDPDWRHAKIMAIDARIRSRISPQLQTEALINLAKVLHWAGKAEDAERLARRAVDTAGEDRRLAGLAHNTMINLARQKQDWNLVDRYIEDAFTVDPWNPRIHYQRGLRLFQKQESQKGDTHVFFATAGAAHILYAGGLWDSHRPTSILGLILYQQGRFELAYPFLAKAVQRSPGDKVSQDALKALSRELGPHIGNLPLPQIKVDRTPDGRPSRVFMQKVSSSGDKLADGIYTEWHENGTVKRYAEFARGIRHGLDIEWAPDGRIRATTLYVNGKPKEGGS